MKKIVIAVSLLFLTLLPSACAKNGPAVSPNTGQIKENAVLPAQTGLVVTLAPRIAVNDTTSLLQPQTTPDPSVFPPPVMPGDIVIPPDDVLYYHPAALRWLTEDEKTTIIAIAMNSTRVQDYLRTWPVYSTSLGWQALVWTDAGKTQWSEMQNFPYDIVDRGVERPGVPFGKNIVTHGVPYSAEIYPCVVIAFGDPMALHADVAVELSTNRTWFSSNPPRFPITITPP